VSNRSQIEWTDTTWNPVRGCARVSEGCRNCYAERVAARFAGDSLPYAGLIHPTTRGWNGKVALVPESLAMPWRMTRGRRIFVNSMSDLFHPAVPFEFIAAVFFVMAHTTRHTYQILTKRPERALEFFRWVAAGEGVFPGDRISDVAMANPAIKALGWEPTNGKRGGYDNCGPAYPFENVWLGVSVEDQAAADERIPLLLQCPASVRWVSAEPLLGPVDLTRVHGVPHCAPFDSLTPKPNGYVRCVTHAAGYCMSDCAWRWPGLDWVVVGGESGRDARPMHPDWARTLRDQCAAAGVPFLFKQWGEFSPTYDRDRDDADWRECGAQARKPGRWINYAGGHGFHGMRVHYAERVGKKAAGRLLDGVMHDEYPGARHA